MGNRESVYLKGGIGKDASSGFIPCVLTMQVGRVLVVKCY